MNKQGIHTNKNERVGIYRFFAGLFLKPPDRETFETMKLLFGIEVEDTPDSALSDFNKLLKLLPPYESLYRKSPPVTSPHLFYEAEGLMLDEELEMPSDHIGVELLFMSYLVENERLPSQINFLEGHLLKWVPLYMDMLEKTVRGDFYKTTAAIAKGFLLSDYEWLLE